MDQFMEPVGIFYHCASPFSQELQSKQRTFLEIKALFLHFDRRRLDLILGRF